MYKATLQAFRRKIDNHIKYEPKLCREGISRSVAHQPGNLIIRYFGNKQEQLGDTEIAQEFLLVMLTLHMSKRWGQPPKLPNPLDLSWTEDSQCLISAFLLLPPLSGDHTFHGAFSVSLSSKTLCHTGRCLQDSWMLLVKLKLSWF